MNSRACYAAHSSVAANIEIKAVLDDVWRAAATARRLSGSAPRLIEQEDVFFPVPSARLKLRTLGPDSGELIRYQRPDIAGPRVSDYTVARTSDPRMLLSILREVLGTLGTVRKKRLLFLVGQTRVHLDDVEDLGHFLEFEVVLRPGQTEEEGYSIIEHLLTEFEIDRSQLRSEAYIDLLRLKQQ